MAGKNKPSIYSDRGTIGSSDELDEYGVWVKSEPQDLSAAGVDGQESAEASVPVLDELPDFNTDFEGDELPSLEQDDFDIPDLDIPEEQALSGSSGENAGFDDFSLPETAGLSSAETGFTEVSMEDFLDGEPDLPAKTDAGFTAPAEKVKNGSGADLSTQLLIKIADELSSIRSELATLKKEFAGIHPEASGADKTEGPKKGFFDEEEDEKIALTGDELDNILNTADFTEEAGADATEELPGVYPSTESEGLIPSDPFQLIEEDVLPDILSDQSDIISGAEPVPGPVEDEKNPEEDDIVIDIDFDSIDLEALNKNKPEDSDASLSIDDADIRLDDGAEAAKDSEELQLLREEGASPMTFAPEDTSYLDEELTKTGGEDIPLDEDVIDLSDAVIDEPDLSGEITENPVEEPSLEAVSFDTGDDDIGDDDAGDDITIDLDFEKIDPETHETIPDLAQPKEEEISLSIPEPGVDIDLDLPGDAAFPESSAVEEENLAGIIPEGFEVEAEDSPVPLDEGLEEDVLSEGDIDTLEKSSAVLDLEEPGPDLSEAGKSDESLNIPADLKEGLRTVLSYMDQLLESLPEDKIEEFAKSEYFDIYKKLFKELGLD
jgi:hypothetical protein